MGAGGAPLCPVWRLGCLPGGCSPPEPLPEGSGVPMGYKPMGFGALPQAGLGCVSPVTHPRLLSSPGTSWPSRTCHHCPPTLPGAPILSPRWSKQRSRATGRGREDPAPGVQVGLALVREISSQDGCEGMQRGAWAGQGSRDVLQRGQLCLSQVCGDLQSFLRCPV